VGFALKTVLEITGFRLGAPINKPSIEQGCAKLDSVPGHTGATTQPERVLHEDERTIELNISFYMGPLYHFGQLRINGLRRILKPRRGGTWKLEINRLPPIPEARREVAKGDRATM